MTWVTSIGALGFAVTAVILAIRLGRANARIMESQLDLAVAKDALEIVEGEAREASCATAIWLSGAMKKSGVCMKSSQCVAMMIVGVALLWPALGGCCPQKTMRVETVRRGWLHKPPPMPLGAKRADITDGGTSNCPESWAACLTSRAVVVLRKHLEDMKRYAHDAWDLCRPISNGRKNEIRETDL